MTLTCSLPRSLATMASNLSLKLWMQHDLLLFRIILNKSCQGQESWCVAVGTDSPVLSPGWTQDGNTITMMYTCTPYSWVPDCTLPGTVHLYTRHLEPITKVNVQTSSGLCWCLGSLGQWWGHSHLTPSSRDNTTIGWIRDLQKLSLLIFWHGYGYHHQSNSRQQARWQLKKPSPLFIKPFK